MLKVSNKSRKNDQLDTIQVIEKCTKIMKEDRLQLRQMVKDENLKLIELIAKHKRKNDLNDLQQELRKFLKDKKGSPEKVQGAPVVLRKVKSKERCEWNTQQSLNHSIRSPSRSNLDFRKKQKEESYKKLESLKKIEKLENQIDQKENDDYKILDEIQEVKPEQQTVLFNSTNAVTNPFQEDLTPVKMEFQTVVSQAPLNQSDIQSECILQYNVADIQHYMQYDRHYISKETYNLPNLISLNYKEIAPSDYQNLFTDWNSLLYNQEQQKCNQNEEIQNLEQSKSINLKTDQSQVVKSLEIRGVTAEELFTYLVLHRFTKRLNQYQLIENAKISIPNAQLDLESLFKLSDHDDDGWISLEELGQTLTQTCIETEQNMNPIKGLYVRLNGKVNMENFMNAMNDKIQGEILYHEIDLFSKGFITYWEMYNHYEEIEKLLKY